jgi:hypothetical protein
MANYKFFILGAVGLLGLAIAPANLVAAPVSGDSEIEVSGGFSHAQGSGTGNFNADIHYGYYLTPGWELGLRQALNYQFIDRHRDSWIATTTPFIFYNFQFNEKFIPYLGADIGVVWNDRDVTGTLGPNAGLKIFLSDQSFLNLGYRYEWFFDRIHASTGNHVANIGLGFVWGGARGTAKP